MPLLARVPDDYRTAIELTDLGELTQEQAAAQLGLSTSGMKSRVQRGRRMLRTEVGRCCRIELDARGAIDGAPDAPRRRRPLKRGRRLGSRRLYKQAADVLERARARG